MLNSFLIGLVGGARSLTPLAAVAIAANRGLLPRDNGAPALLGHPLVVTGIVAVAAGELLGDKWKKAPDRIVPAGLAARMVSGAVTGAALAPRDQRVAAAAAGALGAIAASFLTFDARMKALHQYGQTRSGLVEDALTIGAATAVVASAPTVLKALPKAGTETC